MISDLVQFYDKVDQEISFFNSTLKSENKEQLMIQQVTKVVEAEGERVYKLMPLMQGLSENMFAEYLANQNTPFLLPSKIERIWPNVNAILISQKRISVIPRVSREQLEDFFKRRGFPTSLIDDYHLTFYEVNNCGIDENGIFYIFDVVYNLYPTLNKVKKLISLQDRKGKKLLTRRASWLL